MPPFRSAEDLIKLQEAIANKTVATICSDHQPHNEDAKQAPFSNTQHGISSIEILLPLLMELVDLGLIDINTAISSVTSNPANILGIDTGIIKKVTQLIYVYSKSKIGLSKNLKY